jgi:hypothetical protein
LQSEQKFIRKELKKSSKDGSYENGHYMSNYDVLRSHKLHHVRPESRATQLLYAFSKGVPRRVVEPKIRFDEYEQKMLYSRMERKAKIHQVDLSGLREWFDDVEVI